jgi:hypothetical protein
MNHYRQDLTTLYWQILNQQSIVLYNYFSFDQTEFMKFISPVSHDQHNLGRFCQGLTQDWYCATENELGLTFLSLGPPNPYAFLWTLHDPMVTIEYKFDYTLQSTHMSILHKINITLQWIKIFTSLVEINVNYTLVYILQ